ncbi:unnamed protein product [Adineta steineri]|uniref:Peptidase C14 caspase domain-containing protein n=1 Tax=Adineta steineri TaxID=433720 RepID=A0A820AMN4_9BILA|nr:unnamed protein product [Adineta steineri]CAF4194422.1 unnamed protein product [Adineta steineri]
MFQQQALVIGNDTYQIKPRRTCVNDANDISFALRTIGFISHCATNLESATMVLRINRFIHSIEPHAIVVVYFSGLAVQHDGKTYLMPIDNSKISPKTIRQSAYDAENIIALMHTKSPRAVILILDCARPYQNVVGETPFFVDRNPLELLQGLAPIRPPPSTIIANSCEVGAQFFGLADNGRNSIYTYHLLRYITTPNIDIDTIFRLVALDVQRSTGGRQRPDRYSSVYEILYLVINPYLKNFAWANTMQPAQPFR